VNNIELAGLVREKQSLKLRLRRLTQNIEEIQQILARIDEIDRQLGV
jgi:hypothetical protein